jgi:hypothetical protein
MLKRFSMSRQLLDFEAREGFEPTMATLGVTLACNASNLRPLGSPRRGHNHNNFGLTIGVGDGYTVDLSMVYLSWF